MTAMAILKRIGWLALCGALAGGCKKSPTPRCDPSQSGRDPSQTPDVAQCGGPEGGVCDPIANICTWTCLTDGDCTAKGLDGKRWLCSDGLCRDFAKDGVVDMAQAGPRADYCRKNSDCPGSWVCDAYGKIQPIPFMTHPADMADAGPIGKVPWGRAGRCIAKELVFYVNRDASCANGDGTQAQPFCDIAKALTAPLTPDMQRSLQPVRRVIRVRGSEGSYGGKTPMDLRTDVPLYLMGPGQRHDEAMATTGWGTEQSARLSGITVGPTQEVVLDGLYFEGITDAATLDCEGTANVSILRSYLTAPPDTRTMLVGQTCTLNLDSDWFSGISRQNGALQFQAHTTVRNCIFTGNRATVLIALAPAGSSPPDNVFEHNTLIGNPDTPKTVDCNTTQLSLATSLLQDSESSVSRVCETAGAVFNGSGTYLRPRTGTSTGRCPPYDFVSTSKLECAVGETTNTPWDYYGRSRSAAADAQPRPLCIGAEAAAQPPETCR